MENKNEDKKVVLNFKEAGDAYERIVWYDFENDTRETVYHRLLENLG